ncbi:MAG TPA: anti-CBASS Acb1 family protein [Gaiellaceae bacterium]
MSLTQALSDSWKSLLGSFGGRSDRGRADRMRLLPNATLDDHTLSNAYKDLWLVRRLVEDRTQEALRSGWGVPETEKLENFVRLNTATHEEGAFERACHMADLKGGAGLFIGYKASPGQDLLEPAPPGTEVAFLEVFDRFQLQGMVRDREVDSPTYDQPQIWQVIGPRRSGLRFHTSRMIRFPGAAKPTDFGASEQDRDWGYSRLQAVWDDVVRYGVFWQSVAHLMQVSSVGVLKLHGLIELLATKRQADAEARIDLLNETLALTRLMMLDAKQGEEYHREAVSFADMPALLQEIALATAGAFREPVTKLFGRAPAGMNATGESDMRQWYDEVQSYAQRTIHPRLEKLLEITEGRHIEVEFESLWQPTEQEQATIRNLEISGHERLWSMKVVSGEEIRAALIDGKLPEKTVSGPPPEEPELEPAQPLVPPNVQPPPVGSGNAGSGEAAPKADAAPTIIVNVPAPQVTVQQPPASPGPSAEEVADEIERRHGLDSE